MKLNLENHITGKIKRIHQYWFITDYDLNKYKSKYFNEVSQYFTCSTASRWEKL